MTESISAGVNSGSIWLLVATGIVCLIIGGVGGGLLHPAAGGMAIKAGVIAMVLAGIIIAGLLVWGLSNSALLTQLSSVAASRGVVTYLLIITTACVIVIAAIGNFWIQDNVQEKQRASKDLVALLLTLVGPILGFYFGSSTPVTPSGATAGSPPASVSAPADPATPAPASGGPQGSLPAAPGDVSTPVKAIVPTPASHRPIVGAHR